MSEELGTAEVASLLGVSRPRVWQLRKRPDFPRPSGSKDGRDYWYKERIWRWAAQAGRELAQRAPVLFRPAASTPPEFLGGRVERGHVVHTWVTGSGRISLVHPARMSAWIEGKHVVELDPDATTIVVVRSDFDRQGPCVDALDLDGEPFYHVGWEDVSRHLGGPAPWWPPALRRPEEMTRWRPGSPTMITPAVPPLDVGALWRAISYEPDSSTTRDVLTYLASTVQHSGMSEALNDIAYLERVPEGAITLAARPAATREPGEEPPEVVRRDGWARILERSDALADQCVTFGMQWSGGIDFPFSSIARVDTEPEGIAADWVHTLEPTSYTSAHHMLANGGRYLRDPATGLPAIEEYDGTVWAAVPHRLPTTSPLAEIIFDSEVWIRTMDGSLYLCPATLSEGVSYGYNGTGPRNLAMLLDRLLDDITSGIADTRKMDPHPGLLALTTRKWTHGESLSRAQLLVARR